MVWPTSRSIGHCDVYVDHGRSHQVCDASPTGEAAEPTRSSHFFLLGALFESGLDVSGMIHPQKVVQVFLDVWDSGMRAWLMLSAGAAGDCADVC